ncbi:MAG: hypothetical protein A3C84_03045 [Candidatus Ryanbacteria bacterium RIFCSPHIGHO2_02_FULL_48_12]|uniref:Uncharacterized protein n=1 Tax=Candidatus Ryanbacteria bacterium RIFCSPHIGHO2_01_FULL_48_27 TaxID=1802115 RepID=A0A1G2G5Q6_9BACT|nr:MAG: hypothetical protein A2756_01515 [Candidatus Ryanbacteria bacterium RIFCSPHIGHO2_01_FULL_48_27]OGZ49077.1 MAG: hypothetical protein A3C84_03045 [Candidatus Ryanbacteria bacterium RIFCSPHIGHO2_02_FULL_48_12]
MLRPPSDSKILYLPTKNPLLVGIERFYPSKPSILRGRQIVVIGVRRIIIGRVCGRSSVAQDADTKQDHAYNTYDVHKDYPEAIKIRRP